MQKNRGVVMHKYRDGYREGVAFIFIKDDKILTEERKNTEGEYERFFPSGSVEEFDVHGEKDYRVNTMFREIGEEFQHTVGIQKYRYLFSEKVQEINVIFYIYLIEKWDGNVPEYTVEEGEIHARLEWIDLNRAEEYFSFESAINICSKIKESI